MKRLGAVRPTSESMETELSELTSEKQFLAAYKNVREETQEYKTIKQNVNASIIPSDGKACLNQEIGRWFH